MYKRTCNIVHNYIHTYRISSDERRPISPSSLSSDSTSRRALPSSEEQDTSRETSDDEDLQSFSTSK